MRRLLLQYLDLTDCLALDDAGLKIVVKNCPQLVYLYMRRCVQISGKITDSLDTTNIYVYILTLRFYRRRLEICAKLLYSSQGVECVRLHQHHRLWPL